MPRFPWQKPPPIVELPPPSSEIDVQMLLSILTCWVLPAILYYRATRPASSKAVAAKLQKLPGFAPWSRAFDVRDKMVELDTDIPQQYRQPFVHPDPTSQYWERCCSSKEERMRINGETARQMEWATKEKSSGRDHSLDEPWVPDPSLAWIDTYLLCVMVVMLVPKALLLVVPLLLSTLPVTILTTVYGGCFLPAVADRPKRDLAFVFTFYVLGPLLMLPFTLCALLALLYDYAYYYAFGIPLWIIRGCPSRAGSMSVIAPFQGGPALWTRPQDFLVLEP